MDDIRSKEFGAVYCHDLDNVELTQQGSLKPDRDSYDTSSRSFDF